MLYFKLGEHIQNLRKKKGLTQEQLAERANMNATHIGHIEQGRRKPLLTTLEKIAKALNVRVKDLIPF